MENIYYHVVTNKQMQLNQIIVFDKYNTSGLYDRVYALKTVVDDIYNNPSKYKNEKLDHHTKVALRELALEKVRKEKYLTIHQDYHHYMYRKLMMRLKNGLISLYMLVDLLIKY